MPLLLTSPIVAKCARILVVSLCVVLPIAAAEPITITFEDIFNQPVNRDQTTAPFTSHGVEFSGGSLWRRESPFGSWYQTRRQNAVQMRFPPGATEISFDADGFGGSIILFEYMNLQVWNGPLGSGTIIATIPISATTEQELLPPKHRITVPGSAMQITIFTAPPPSGTRNYGNFIAVDNVRYTPADPNPTFTFDLPVTSNQKVLTHNYGNHPYPSALQTKDRAIRVEGTVTLNDQPAAGKTVHFRVRDPEDTAPYVRQFGDHHMDDNFDGPGYLNGTGSTVATAVSDAAGRVSVTLDITEQASGDNYQIEASMNASFNCASQCKRSAIYTAWKRVYVEVNKMFRRGAYVLEDVSAGSKMIRISDVNQFPETPFQVRLIHAPRVNGGPPDFYSETVTVTDVTGRSWLGLGVRPGILHLNPDPNVPGIQQAYYAGEAVGAQSVSSKNAPSKPRPYLADAVGLVTGDRNADFFLLDTSLVNGTFGDAFTEHVWMTDATPGIDPDLAVDQPSVFYDGLLPFDATIDDAPEGDQSEWMARKWIRHADRFGQDRVAHSNHQAVFTATNHPRDNGFNRVGSGFNDLWMFVRQMGNATLIAESLVHELTHEFRVNQPGGHCDVTLGTDQKMYNRNLKCTMHSKMGGDPNDAQRRDGFVGFHYVRVGQKVDSEYLGIRRRNEPIPQNDDKRPQPK